MRRVFVMEREERGGEQGLAGGFIPLAPPSQLHKAIPQRGLPAPQALFSSILALTERLCPKPHSQFCNPRLQGAFELGKPPLSQICLWQLRMVLGGEGGLEGENGGKKRFARIELNSPGGAGGEWGFVWPANDHSDFQFPYPNSYENFLGHIQSLFFSPYLWGLAVVF